MKAALSRLGIRGFNPKLKKAAERLEPRNQFTSHLILIYDKVILSTVTKARQLYSARADRY
jgi:hypothetical protein